jgi:hypothetical protein
MIYKLYSLLQHFTSVNFKHINLNSFLDGLKISIIFQNYKYAHC